MDILSPTTIVTKILVLLVAFPIHEFAHAWTANHFGDDTPRLHGRLTLNPFAHLDVAGSLIFMLSYFGWAKPVPVNPSNLNRNNSKAYLLVSLAGPMSNLGLAIIAAIPVRLGLISITNNFFSMVLLNFIIFNLILAIFNLIPLSPLDGGKVLSEILPTTVRPFFETINRYGPMILLALLFVLPTIGFNPIGAIINPIFNGIFGILTGR